MKSTFKSLKTRWENWLLRGDDQASGVPEEDLAADAQWAAGQQNAKGSRILLWVSLAAVFVLIVWACLGHIDEVVRGQGKVVPSRQVQVVQSLDGGIVEEILVRPGQHVEVGQVLLRIDPTRFTSSLGGKQGRSAGVEGQGGPARGVGDWRSICGACRCCERSSAIARDGATCVGGQDSRTQYHFEHCERSAQPAPAGVT